MNNNIIVDGNKYLSCSDLFKKNTPSAEEQDYILTMVADNWKRKRKGYRKGVWLVPLNPTYCPKYFKSNIVKLSEGDYLLGQFEKRVPKEHPRKKVSVLAKDVQLMPLKSVDVVVYSRSVLAEGNENSDPNADFEILIVLKKVVNGDQPMPPDTMMYNYFKANGGTSMKCTEKKFVAQLKESFNFWKDKAIIH